MSDTYVDPATVGEKRPEQVKPVAPKPAEKSKFLTVKTVNKELYDNKAKYESLYPFSELEVGGAFFVPNEAGKTVEQNSLNMHKEVARAREFYSEIEVDDDGDEVLENVTIRNTVRNNDGTLKLQADGTPITGANLILRPRLVYFRHFIIYSVKKDYDLGGSKAPEDGVLVVRVW